MNEQLVKQLLLSKTLKPIPHFYKRCRQRGLYFNSKRVAKEFEIIKIDGQRVVIATPMNEKFSVLIIIDTDDQKLVSIYKREVNRIKKEEYV